MGLIHRERRDIFYKIAKALGYRSRSALKLLQIHETTNILDGKFQFFCQLSSKLFKELYVRLIYVHHQVVSVNF